jgi:large subunit ribosomal protein L22
MSVKAETKYVRISAFKAREVARHIRGLSVDRAMDLLEFSTLKAARLMQKTLKSAVANAEHNAELNPDNLFVKEVFVNEGPTIKRVSPRARGSAGPILKRTSHFRVIVAERDIEAEEKAAQEKKTKAAAAKAARAKKPAKAKA